MEIAYSFMVYVSMLVFAILAIAEPQKKYKNIIVIAFTTIAVVCGYFDIKNKLYDSAKEPELEIESNPTLKIEDKNYIVSIPIEAHNNNYAYKVFCNAWGFVRIKDTLVRGYGSPSANYDIVKRKDINAPTFTIPKYWRKDIDTAYIVISIQFKDAQQNVQPNVLATYAVVGDNLMPIKSGARYAEMVAAYSDILAQYR